MRIAYVTETWPPELNGVSLTVERTVRFLRSRGHLVELIRPRQPGEVAPRRRRRVAHRRLRHSDVPRPALRPGPRRHAGAPLPRTAGPTWSTWRRRARCPGRRSPRRGALGIATTSDFRTNFHQYTPHYGLGLLAGPALGLMRRFHNLTRRTFVPTQAARRELAAAGFHNLTVVGRGVDTERFTPAARSEALRAQWQAGPETPVLLAVGRIAAEKNVELALRAFERARRDRPDLRMVVVGDGPARARLTAAHPAATLRRRQARRRAGGALRLGRRVPVPEPLRHLRQRRHGGARLRPAGGLVRLRRGRRARRRRPAAAAWSRPATKPASSPPPPRSRPRRPALQSFREAAVAAARRATWDEVLERFEARLQDTVDAFQASPAAVPVVA